MPRAFSHSTAEQVVQVVEAVEAFRQATSQEVQDFCDLSQGQADNALTLAEDLGLINKAGTNFKPATSFSSFVSSPDEAKKAAVIRVVLESYEPFVVFRQRLQATASADKAAEQTKALLSLSAHREEVKDTLISLGTYTGAIISAGGGKYSTVISAEIGNPVLELSAAATDQATAELLIRTQIGPKADRLDRTEVVLPLASALLKAKAGDVIGAVTDAARSVESFLGRLAIRTGVSLAGTNGISQKLDKFRAGNQLPKKVVEAAKYLGHVRNAADHGLDADAEVGAAWIVQPLTATLYVHVACAFMNAALEREDGGGFVI
jgi:hypothetical protein